MARQGYESPGGVPGAPAQGAYTQTYSATSKTHPNLTSSAVATTAASLTAYGFAQAQANSIPVAINALRADVDSLKQLVNALIDDLQALNLIQ